MCLARALPLLLAAVPTRAFLPAGDELTEWIGAELGRLTEEGVLTETRAAALDDLLFAGRPHLALERLGEAVAEHELRLREASHQKRTETKAGFDALLREVGGGMVAAEAAARAAEGAGLCALARARLELSLAEASEYTHTAERFSVVEGPNAGKTLQSCGVYLAMALSSLERARWLAGAPRGAAAAAPLLALETALAETERRMLERVEADLAEAGRLRNPNSALRLARELLEAGRTDAALLHYLQARRALADPAAAAAPAPQLTERAAKLRAELAGLAGDTTLGALFLELAEDELAHGATGGAGVLLGDVVPEFLRLRAVEERAEPSSKSDAAPAAASPPTLIVTPLLTVTLVRWPFS